MLAVASLSPRLLAQCQGDVPTGVQTYFVLGHEQHVWDMMTRVRLGEGGTPAFSSGVNSIISAVASADNQVIYYDHWEDGYDPNLTADPATCGANCPQATSLVLGDGNAANGTACSFTNDPRVLPCGGPNQDRFFQGTAIVLNSDQGITGACTPAAANVRCSVPVNPRGVAPTAVRRFDGGDLVVTSGGPLSIIHSQDPLYPYIGGATEMLSQQATANANAFTVPVGENLYRRYANPGDDTPTEIFKYVDLDLVAYQDNTQVFVNSPVDVANPGVYPGGAVSFTLMRGQHWSSRGFIHGGTVAGAAPAVQVNAGTRISTTGPLGGLIFTAGDSDSTQGYATDFFPLLPDLLHATDYTLPVPGNVPSGASPMNVYIFNPSPLSTLTVTGSDSTGTTTFTLPPNGFVVYSDPAAMNRFPPAASTVRLTANRAFWGVAVIDSNNNAADWGYAWLGNRFLTGSYTCSATPGVLNPAANASTSAQRTTLSGDADCTIPPAGAVGACNSANRQPVWIGATQDNTRVRIDFNNDGLFDLVDTDSDDCPNQGQATSPNCAPIPAAYVGTCGLVAGPANCVYTINAGSAPRYISVYDYTDYDNTGTQIVGDKPLAVAYGQDPEQTLPLGAETYIVDTGYVIFPLIQAFLDPVLVLDKTSDRTTVPATAGGQVIYTLTLRSYGLPMTDVRLRDLLPPMATGDASAPAYVPGSTLITFPDLSQSTAEPQQTTVGTQTQLNWPTLASAAFSMPPNATLTIRYAVSIPAAGNPAGPATVFSNTAVADGRSGNSIFSPRACASVVRTSVVLTKTVVHDGTPEVGDGTPAAGEAENLTYGLTVQNVDQTGVLIVDPIPADTTFAGGIISPAPFTGAAAGRFDPVQNAVVWGPATLTSAMGPLTLGFQVAINPGVAVGTSIRNRGQFESTQTPVFYSNEVLVTVVGASLTANKTASVASARPGQTFTFEVHVQNGGTAPADNVMIRDPLPAGALYVPGTLEWRLNAGAFQPLTDQADTDQGTLFADRIEFGGVGAGITLGVTQDVTLRFQVRVTGAGGQFVNNQATVGSSEVDAFFTNLVQIPIIGDAVVNGRLFLDLDSDGNVDAGEAGIANVDVVITDSAGGVQRVTTDGNGNYTVTVPAGATTLNVDETDPDFPSGALITTGAPPRPPGNDTQTVTAVSGATINPATAGCGVAAPPYCAVGYFPGNITVAKRSNGNNELSPGQVVTYTVTIRNNTGVTQNDVTLTDAVPAGMTFVNGSTQIQRRGPNPVFRVTEVQVPASCTGAAFGGTGCTLNVLAAGTPISADYFAIVQGSSSVTDGGADDDYVRVTDDFLGTGDFGGGVVASHQLQLTRGNGGGDWAGVVTVVECLTSCDTAGFRLRSVEDVAHGVAASTGTDTSATAWTDVNQVMLMGGFNGAGCQSANTTVLAQPVCHARFTPSGTNTINWTRATPSPLTLANSTVYAVEWGTQWTVQHVRVTGTAGGDDLNAAAEYNGAFLPQNVARDNTWLWATGFAAGNTGNIGTQAEAAIATLGNGQVENAIEGRVAVGTEVNGTPVDFEVWALTHLDLRTDWVKKGQGTTDGGGNVAVTVASAAAGTRMALVYNGNSSTSNDYPSPILNARYTANTTINLNRRLTTGAYPAWVQGIDFAIVREVVITAGNDAPGLVTAGNNVDLGAGETVTVTFQMRVDDPLAAGIDAITNTASGTSVQSAGPFDDSATDAVLRPGVVVEYDNAGFASSPGFVTYGHRVTNTGARPDSFLVTAISETNPLIPAGWRLDLINPTTGAVIATDTDGDGAWDAGLVINTGLLNPGESLEYQLRVTVPAGFAVGRQQTARLRARSDRQPSLFDDGVDETTVLGSTDVGPVILIPDNSGVVIAGGSTVYTHRVFNNTGATDTFDLRADSSQAIGSCPSTQPPRDPACWFAAIYYDSNGDGLYTPGMDIQIANTSQLAAGASQTFFVVVEARPGALGGEVDVTHLTATSRNNPNQFDGATDTTTVVVSGMDLSGGGSLLLTQGAVGVYPGTLINQGTATDRFNFELTPSSLFGVDFLSHPTELWIDVNGDGSYAPGEFAGADTDGDGDWDTFGPAFNGDTDSRPDVQLAAGVQMSYELRRQVHTQQAIGREFSTLTARSTNGASGDSVTATNLLAAVTRATVRGVRVDRSGSVSFATGSQHGTAGFELYASEGPRGARTRLTEETVASPAPDTMVPVVYKVRTAVAVSGTHLWIEEIETDGDRRMMGPFPIGDRPLERALARVEARLEAAGVADAPVRRAITARDKRPRRRARRAPEAGLLTADADASSARVDQMGTERDGATVGARIEVSRPGRVEVSLEELRVRGVAHVPARQLRITSGGQPVPFEVIEGGNKIRFQATELSTDYTGRNTYLVTSGAPQFGMEVPLTRSSLPPAPGAVRVERNWIYVANAPEATDPWLWDLVFGDGSTWPYEWWDPTAGDFDLPGLSATAGQVRIRLTGSSDHRHAVTASINGRPVGSVTFTGKATAVLTGTAQDLQAAGNQLTLTYTSSLEDGTSDPSGLVYLDHVELDVPAAPPVEIVEPDVIAPWRARLANLGPVEYLIVTHPRFLAAARRVAEAKEAQGLTTRILRTDRIYDRFSQGIAEANAIKAAIALASRKSRALKYVLLIGDDTFDTHDSLGTGAESLIPSLLARDGEFGRVPSENRYADLDNDGAPDLAIGRLPVQTVEQAEALADKIASQESVLGAYATRHLFAVDNDLDSDSPFRAEADAVANRLGAANRAVADVGQGVAGARDVLTAAWGAGAAFSHYFGHGGVDVWGDERLLAVEDVDAMTIRPTVLLAWACQSQWYLNLWGPAINEALVLKPGGGALATFGPVGISSPAHQKALYDAFYGVVAGPRPTSGLTLGEAIRRAKATAAADPQRQPAIDGFGLLGDPALKLP